MDLNSLDFFQVINLLLVVLGGRLVFSVYQRLSGGKMASSILLFMVAGGIFAIHVVIPVLFKGVWPQPWSDLARDASETLVALVLVLAFLRLNRSLPRGV